MKTKKALISAQLVLTSIFTLSPSISVTTFPLEDEITPYCLTIEDGLPEDVSLTGSLLFRQDRYFNLYTYDFHKREKYRFPFHSNAILDYTDGSFSRSPDGKWIAYIEPIFEVMDYQKYRSGYRSGHLYTYEYTLSVPRLKSRILHLVRYDGLHYDLSTIWLNNWQTIVRWIDNENILLDLSQRPEGTLTLLNPFTGKYQEIFPDYKNWNKSDWWKPQINYSPDLKMAVYPSFVLIRESKTQDALAVSHSISLWSQNGKWLAYTDNKWPNQELYLYDINGNIDQITPSTAYADLNKASWSPDNRYLAIWIRTDSSMEKNFSLSLVDVETSTVKDLCISGGDNILHLTNITWAPNGRWLATSYAVKEKSEYGYEQINHRAIIVDTQDYRVFSIEGDKVVIAWLADN